MSENLELVRSLFAAWERGDFSAVEWAHADIEWTMVDGPLPGSWTGLAGIVEMWRDWLSTWEALQVGAEEYRELDDKRVLVLCYWGGRGKASGLELGQMRSDAAGLVHLRGGKVTRVVAYFDRDRALADLGLAE